MSAYYGEASSSGNSAIKTRLKIDYSNHQVSSGLVDITVTIQYMITNSSTTYKASAPYTIQLGTTTISGSATFDVRGFTRNTWYNYASYKFTGGSASNSFYCKSYINLSGTSASSCTSEATIPAYVNYTDPTTGNLAAYAYDNRKNNTVNAGGWFESAYIDFNSYKNGTNNPIKYYELWYQQCDDNGSGSPNGNWSGRVHVRSMDISENTQYNAKKIVGSVNNTTTSSNWGDRGKWYRWNITAIGTVSGTWSNTDIWTSPMRKCTYTTYSFNANGGSGAPANHYKFIGYDFKFPSTSPTRTGYSFAGWKSGSAGPYSANQLVSGLNDNNITWYAQWNINSYTLTVKPNGGTWNGSTSDQAFTQNYNTTKTIANPTRSGYRFNGWSKSGSGSLSGTTFTYGAGNATLTATWVKTYMLDINIYVDGVQNNAPSKDMLTFDLYINGAIKYEGISDSAVTYDTGTTWEIKNIKAGSNYVHYKTGTISGTLTADYGTPGIYLGSKHTITYKANGGSESDQTQTVNYGTSWTTKGAIFTKTGYTQTGWNTAADGSGTNYGLSAAQSATQSDDVTLYAKYTPNSYTDEVVHWAFGFLFNEGNNDAKNAIRLALNEFTQNYNATFTLNEANAITIPNGYYLRDSFSSPSITGSWAPYPMGTSITQITDRMHFEYYYDPYSYNITYNLNGGTNNSNNPSSYTVLYGLTFSDPVRDNYNFLGWYIGNTRVTGINEGKNADGFSSLTRQQVMDELASRTVGDITVEARWEPKGNIYVNTGSEQKLGILHVFSNGQWNVGEIFIDQGGDWFSNTAQYVTTSEDELLTTSDGDYIVTS